MKKCFRKGLVYVSSLILVLGLLSACGKNTDNSNEKEQTSQNTQQTINSETEKPDVSEQPDVSEESNSSEETSNLEAPSSSQQPSDSEKPSNSEKPSSSEKPSDSENTNTESSKPEPAPSEPEASISTSAPGWDKVPSFKESNLTEKEMAVKIVECIISSTMSDFEKALEIHDWLIFNVDYDHTYSNYHAINAFVDRSCVCQGYAEAFELLAEAAGLETTFVSGVATNSSGQTESHAWNQIKISGAWYNVDVTWDDPTHEGKDFNDHSGNGYDYFLISKAQLEKDHKAESYNEGEKTCSSNYDKVSILKVAAASGRYGDVAVVTNISEANAGIKKYMDQNKSTMTLWIYDSSVTVATSQNYIQNLVGKVQYVISLSTYYPSDNGILKCPIGITPSSEWDAIPVVTNVDEFKTLLDQNGDAGITSYTVRYESTSGQPVIAASKYGFNISYVTYNDGNSWLIDVFIQ